MRPLGSADPRTIGPYQLLGVLGSGGMGRVYLGASRTGRRVAIKVIRPDLAEDPTFRDRFAREVEAAGRVSPLFTALVVDSDTEAAAPWLATTYIEGVSLDRRVLDDGAMSVDDVLSLAAGLGEALTSIHEVGLVHRDLKPSNILLNDSGPHIIDFGLALGNEQTRLTTSKVVGTPAYMAPERLKGDAAGPPSDVFSLGATLVFAATGRDLVDEANVYKQVLQIAEGRFNLADVPTQLRALVVRCVSFEPFDRPTAAELTRFVVALGTVTPGVVVEVATKISTKHRAEARAAGVPLRTTPRPNDDLDVQPTDDSLVEATPSTVEPVADSVSNSEVDSESDSEVDQTPVGAAQTSGSRSEHYRSVIAPRSSPEARSGGVQLSWMAAGVGASGDGPIAGAPPSGRPSAGGPIFNGPSFNGPTTDGPTHDGPTHDGPTTDGADADGEWRSPHPSDPNLERPAFDLLPPRSRWTRRQLMTASGVALGVAATGGVLAAVTLAARQRPGSITGNETPAGSTLGPSVPAAGPIADAGPTSAGPIAAGTVLWTVSSGAGAPGIQAQNLPGGQRVVVSPTGVIVALRPENTEVVAINSAGKRLWSQPQVSSNAALWLWGDGVLIADGAWVALHDLGSTRQRFRIQPSRLASQAIGASHGALRVTGLALSASTAFVGLGSAMVGINRSGGRTQAWQVGDRLADTPETPTAASDGWMVTQSVGLLSSLQVYPARSQFASLGQTYAPLEYNVDGTTNPGAAVPGTTDDPAVRMAEARIVNGFVVARIERDIRAFSIADQRPLMHEAEPGPVHAIAGINSSILVASTSLTKYDILTGNRQWQAALPAIRIAVLSQPGQATVVVAATVGGVVGLDAHGRTLWSAHLPGSLQSALPTSITVAPHTVYVTFQLASGATAGSPDVVAIALDGKAHR